MMLMRMSRKVGVSLSMVTVAVVKIPNPIQTLIEEFKTHVEWRGGGAGINDTYLVYILFSWNVSTKDICFFSKIY